MLVGLDVQLGEEHKTRAEVLVRICLAKRAILKTALEDNTKMLRYYVVYRVSQEERAKLREGVPYVKLYRYNPKHLYPKLNGYGDNGKRSLKL